MLEPAGTPFRVWAQHLAEYARAPAVLAELPAWEASLMADAAAPERDARPGARHRRPGAPSSVDSRRVTAKLLTAVPSVFHCRGSTTCSWPALAVAVAAWRRGPRIGGDGSVLIDLEGHGREPMAGGIDLSRTVGWFTSLYPVGLDVGRSTWTRRLAGGAAMGRALKRVKEQLRAIPGRGWATACCATLTGGRAAAGWPPGLPQLGFNYLGAICRRASWGLVAAGDEVGGGGADRRLPLRTWSKVNALTLDGPGRAGAVARPGPGPERYSRNARSGLGRGLAAGAGGVDPPCGAAGRWRSHPVGLSLVPLSQERLSSWRRRAPDWKTSCRCRRFRRVCSSMHFTTRPTRRLHVQMVCTLEGASTARGSAPAAARHCSPSRELCGPRSARRG